MKIIKFILFIILINEIYALGIVKNPIKKIKNINFKKLKLKTNLNGKRILDGLNPQQKKLLLKEHYDDFGGSYREGNKLFEGRNGLYEVNHVPPKSAYKGEYSKINPDDMPAHLMEYGDHRNYVTTGSSSDNKIFRNYASDLGNGRSFASAIMNEASVLLRRPRDSDMKFGQSGIDYKKSLLNMADYCENVAIENAPYNKRPDGKGYLLSMSDAAKVRKYINDFKP